MQKQTLIEGLRALPGDAHLLASLASLLESQKQWQELQQVLLEQLPLLPRGSELEAHACYLAARASLELGDLRQALPLCERSLQLQPNRWYSHHIHGRVLSDLGRPAAALQAQQRCAELAPDFPWCWFEIGHLQRAQAETVAARDALERALALQQLREPGDVAPFREALDALNREVSLAERQQAAANLWPGRSLPGPDERLPAIDELALSLEQFRLFLDRCEGRPG